MSSRGIPDSVGRACGSFRLQKSTSGAWPKARVRDERTRADGLAPSLRSRERRSVGSRIRAAKPERPVLGSRSRTLRASGESKRTLVDGRHPESHEIARLDGPAVDVILAAEDALRLGLHANWVSEVAPLFSSAEDNAAGERRTSRARISIEGPQDSRCSRTPPDTAESVKQVGRSSRCAVKRT